MFSVHVHVHVGAVQLQFEKRLIFLEWVKVPRNFCSVWRLTLYMYFEIGDIIDMISTYRIFHGGKYSFFSNKLIFVDFIFVFASSAPFCNTGGHTHLVKFRSLDLFLNEKNEN